MLMSSIVFLLVGVVVISSIAWVSQFRRIRDRMKAAKALRDGRAPENAPEA